jgi:DNA-binding MarR family transcriptional regulator
LESLGLTPKALAILGILEVIHRPTLIAQSIGSPLPTVSNLLKDLENRGYVMRVPGKLDRRQVAYRRTADGDAAMNAGIDKINEGAKAYVERLSEEELAVLAALLARINVEPADCHEDGT